MWAELGTKVIAKKDFSIYRHRGPHDYEKLADVKKGMEGVVCGYNDIDPFQEFPGDIIVSIPLYGICCQISNMWEVEE
jgi:hypothetical protein